MKRFEVQWRFKYGSMHTSIVVAHDKKHAQERVWMLHVQINELRREIEFISVKEVE